MSQAELRLERKGPVQWITFNRPEARNSLTWPMYEALGQACNAINGDPAVRAVVLTGAAGAFVAGTDISQFGDLRTEEDVLQYEARGSQLMAAIESIRVPTIAAIAGACTGAGAIIACASDLRLATPSTRFGFPIARTLGNCLSMSNYARVGMVVGYARLKQLIIQARLMNATELLETGIVSERVDEALLFERAQQLAEEVAGHAPLTVWATKETYRRLRDQLVPQAADRDLVVRCYLSKDFREGVEAFLAKRTPVWSGD